MIGFVAIVIGAWVIASISVRISRGSTPAASTPTGEHLPPFGRVAKVVLGAVYSTVAVAVAPYFLLVGLVMLGFGPAGWGWFWIGTAAALLASVVVLAVVGVSRSKF